MSDVLSPAEQARAARWAADWLVGTGFNTGAGVFVVRALFDHSDDLTPPETVESLRAERDTARTKLAHAECVIRDHHAALNAVRDEREKAKSDAHRFNQRFEAEQEELVQALNKLSDANYTIARLRATHTQAEAAWGRFQDRPARAWKAGDPEPKGVMQVESASSGRIWTKDGTAWRNERCFMSWQHLLEDGGRITEVVR